MKSILAITLSAVTMAAFAAFDVVNGLVTVPVTAPVSISANVTNAHVVAGKNLKGICGVYVAATPALGREIDVTVYNTNAVSGGWSVYAQGRNTDTNCVSFAVPLVGEYATSEIKVEVCPKAETTASVIILGTK